MTVTRSPHLAIALALGATLVAACHRDPREVNARHLAAGDAYAAKGKQREAIIEYRGAIQALPTDGPSHRKLSDAYLAAGDPVNALRAFAKAADAMPDDAGIQLEASRALLMAGWFADAKSRAERMLARDNGNVDARIVLGNALAGLKDLDRAITEIESAIDVAPRRSLSYANLGALEIASGHREKAEAAFLQARALDPRSVPAALALANFHWSAGRLADAERELTEAVTLDPRDPPAQRALAAFYMGTGRREKAEAPLRAIADASDAIGPRIILADYYRDIGSPDRALRILDGVAKDPKGFAPATVRIAMIRYGGAPAEAHRAIDTVLERNPRDVRAQLVKAQFLANEGHVDEALVHAHTAATSGPGSADAHLMEGQLSAQLGRLDQAIASLETVLKLRPGDEQALVTLAKLYAARGDWTSTSQHAQAAVKASPGNRDARLLLARALTERADFHSAEIELKVLLRETPATPAVQYALGRFYLATHDRLRAREALTRAVDGDSADLLALRDLTDLDVSEGRTAAALARLDQRISAAPAAASPLLVLAARVHEAAKDLEAEESALRKATAANPSNLEAYRMLARFYVQQRRVDEALRTCDAITARDPQSADAPTMAGILLEYQGRPVEARAKYERALAVNPRAGIAANNLAWLLTQMGGDLDMALQLAQTAKSAMPDHPEVNDTLGWIYFRKGLTGQALTYLRESVAADANRAPSTYHLALAYQQSGDTGRTRDLLQRALAIAPDFDGAKDARARLQLLGH